MSSQSVVRVHWLSMLWGNRSDGFTSTQYLKTKNSERIFGGFATHQVNFEFWNQNLKRWLDLSLCMDVDMDKCNYIVFICTHIGLSGAGESLDSVTPTYEALEI